MAMTINTNIMSLNAQRNASASQMSLATSMQRLSSGLRINSAKDDAAGLAIADRFTTQIRGLNQAARNANDGISLAQVAEGALGSTSSNLQRIRELAVQAANGTNSASDRLALQQEVLQLTTEISRVGSQTEFNGLKLLDGSYTTQQFQVGANANQTITIDLADFGKGGPITSDLTWDVDLQAPEPGAALGAPNVDGQQRSFISSKESATSVLARLDVVMEKVNATRATMGAVMNRLDHVINNLTNVSMNMSASRSQIEDADYAAASTELAKTQIMQQAATAVLAQANTSQQSVMKLLGG